MREIRQLDAELRGFLFRGRHLCHNNVDPRADGDEKNSPVRGAGLKAVENGFSVAV
ncbi:hypothetical protein [Solidesulfovibrio sp.]